MVSGDETPTTVELIEQAARSGAVLDDFELDLSVALTCARRDVFAAHGRAEGAAHWNELLCRLADLRADRARFRREVDDFTGGGAR